MMMFGREVRSKTDVIKPERKVHERVWKTQENSEMRYNHNATNREFEIDDEVYYRNFGIGPKWVAGVIEKRMGYAMYVIRLNDGSKVNRHIDQIRARKV